VEQSISGEANRFSASQEIRRILRNPQYSLPHSQVPAVLENVDGSNRAAGQVIIACIAGI
jgi:hypothetical protein